MKFIFLLVFPFSGCALFDTHKEISEFLPFSKVAALRAGQTQDEILRRLGSPGDIGKEEARTSWIYYNPQTDAQRLTLYFDGHQRLRSLIWIPERQEQESKLTGAKARFPDAQFRVTPFGPHNPHAITKTEQWTDPELGVAFLYEPSDDLVEGITWMGSSNEPPGPSRAAASSKKIEIRLIETDR